MLIGRKTLWILLFSLVLLGCDDDSEDSGDGRDASASHASTRKKIKTSSDEDSGAHVGASGKGGSGRSVRAGAGGLNTGKAGAIAAVGSGGKTSGVGGTSGNVSNGQGGSGGKTSVGNKSQGGTKASSGGAPGTTAAPNGKSGTTATKTPVKLDNFSFFVTSLKELQTLSNNEIGFGGDLRFGETGAGAGLRGADKICATIAEKSMSGASSKGWRAFLSVTADENGKQVNAIDRIGNGPWYDRLGRVFALTKTDLMNYRPASADTAIQNDFPNEDGIPNHQPDLTQPQVDNHDMLTGTNAQGQLYSATATCKDWTTSDGAAANGKPRVGHSWPRSAVIGGIAGVGTSGGMGHWMSSLDEAGCAPGVYVMERGAPQFFENNVGSGGGYGGFYCFALSP
jgi:hypothetical protein